MIIPSMLVAVLALAATPATARDTGPGHVVVASRSIDADRPFAAWLERQGISSRAAERTGMPIIAAGAAAREDGRYAPWLARHGIAPRLVGKRGVVITAGGEATGRWAPWLARHGIVPAKRG
jgi:hypothetical protein